MKPNIFTLLMMIPLIGFGQSSFEMSEESIVSIFGTSNVHDWSEHCETVSGSITCVQTEDKVDLDNLRFEVRVVSIKSGKNTMDKYTYEALMESDFPTISYASSQVTTSGSGSSLKVSTTGNMSIAGKTKKTNVDATCSYSDSKLKCSGKKIIDMTEFGVEPPSVMFGAMTVGKEVEVHYEILFKEN